MINSSNVVLLAELPQHPIHKELACVPDIPEVVRAVIQVKDNKASGPDGIPAEIYKYGEATLISKIHDHNYLDLKRSASMLRDAVIVAAFKKGDKMSCRNNCDSSLHATLTKPLPELC